MQDLLGPGSYEHLEDSPVHAAYGAFVGRSLHAVLFVDLNRSSKTWSMRLALGDTDLPSGRLSKLVDTLLVTATRELGQLGFEAQK